MCPLAVDWIIPNVGALKVVDTSNQTPLIALKSVQHFSFCETSLVHFLAGFVPIGRLIRSSCCGFKRGPPFLTNATDMVKIISGVTISRKKLAFCTFWPAVFWYVYWFVSNVEPSETVRNSNQMQLISLKSVHGFKFCETPITHF
jgi:hypothetical protein